METLPVIETPKNHFERPSAYLFGALDPRPIDAARQANQKIFDNKNGVLGIEVTIPEYAQKCTLGNIDPQHTNGNLEKAAIDAAGEISLPPSEAGMVTVRPDLDSVGAMALISLRQKGAVLDEPMTERLALISKIDRFDNGPWLPKPLPSKQDIWAGTRGAETSGPSAMIMDFKIPLPQRVANMERWIETGEVDPTYREKAVREREALVNALESGEIKTALAADGKIARVESRHLAGTTIGYSLAPVIVVSNPEFRVQGGEPHLKHTVGQYRLGYVDLSAALEELRKREPGWGGSQTVIGSPQGISSTLDASEISSVVAKCLLQ